MRSTAWLMPASALTLLLSAGTAQARADDAKVERLAGDRLVVSWVAKGPVDVYLADRADAAIDGARLVSADDRDGHEEVVVPPATRRYFLIRDKSDGAVTEVAERLVPLERGSNFRDIGGYEAAGGKHVRWGMIYRSGATPLLTPADQARIAALGLRNMVDLRSDEERQIAPSRIDGVPYAAVGYSMALILDRLSKTGNGGALYRSFPTMLAPQLRIVFADLKRHEGPLVYNCSAGQDRTGFTTAMILSALGVPRETILKDYHLSTTYRRPEFELPKIDPAAYPGNPVAQYFASIQSQRTGSKPQPLYDSDGTPFLAGAFAEIDQKWGSVEAYLREEIGVSDADIAKLRLDYLE